MVRTQNEDNGGRKSEQDIKQIRISLNRPEMPVNENKSDKERYKRDKCFGLMTIVQPYTEHYLGFEESLRCQYKIKAHDHQNLSQMENLTCTYPQANNQKYPETPAVGVAS